MYLLQSFCELQLCPGNLQLPKQLCDESEWKLRELRKRAGRSGADIIETRLIEDTKAIKRLAGDADRVLMDVPCSGLGVLRRNPDAKWKLSLAEIERLQKLQAEILVSHARMVKPGGKLVYATCSILPGENQNQIAAFLAAGSGESKDGSIVGPHPLTLHEVKRATQLNHRICRLALLTSNCTRLVPLMHLRFRGNEYYPLLE